MNVQHPTSNRRHCREQESPSVHATILFFRNKMMAWTPPLNRAGALCLVCRWWWGKFGVSWKKICAEDRMMNGRW